MVDTSQHLRHTLGLPPKEFTRASSSDAQMQEEQVVQSPGEEIAPKIIYVFILHFIHVR